MRPTYEPLDIKGKLYPEPQTVPFKELEERAYNDPDWICVKSALGDSNNATLNISEEKESSSLLHPTSTSMPYPILA